jgi:hypothetical protein
MSEVNMKIRKSVYRRLQCIADTRLIVDTPNGMLMDLKMSELYLIGLYSSEGDWIYPSAIKIVIKSERPTLPSASTIATPATEQKKGM